LNTLTKHEENIYNCYLKAVRKGKPYQPRKDFSNITPTILLSLKKLNAFFTKFKHINPDDFFNAPSLLYPDENIPTLNFFITRAAIRTYSLSIKKQEDESPEKQIEKIKESFHFIAMFCLKNKISIENYLQYRVCNMPAWMQHYREHNINPYSLMELGDVNQFKMLEEDEKALWAGDFFNKFDSYRSRYYNSERTKSFVKEATQKIKLFLKKELQSK
jgi:hypothetical protein